MHRVKYFIRAILFGLLFGGTEPIVVASTGRSGSTLVFDTIAESFIRAYFPRMREIPFVGNRLASWSKCFIDRLSNMDDSPAPIKKTHALYSDEYRDKAMYLFVYGPPLESAISVKSMTEKNGERWFQNHLYHLESKGTLDQLFTEDILRYEDQMRSWGNSSNRNVLCIHYSELWEREAELSEFLGFKITLPEKRARAAKQTPEQYDVTLFDRLAVLEKNFMENGCP